MGGGYFLVFAGPIFYFGLFAFGKRSDDFGGRSHYERPWRNPSIRGDQRSGSYDAVPSDYSAIHDYGAHSD